MLGVAKKMIILIIIIMIISCRTQCKKNFTTLYIIAVAKEKVYKTQRWSFSLSLVHKKIIEWTVLCIHQKDYESL